MENTATAESRNRRAVDTDAALVRAVAKHESPDVAGNIRALEEITNAPDKLDKAYR